MKIPQFFRKLLGIKPIVGDAVCGSLDYSVTYSGVVISMPTNLLFPCYVVNGKISISTDWRSVEVEEKSDIIVPLSRISHA